jgi:hypothetical protein
MAELQTLPPTNMNASRSNPLISLPNEMADLAVGVREPEGSLSPLNSSRLRYGHTSTHPTFHGREGVCARSASRW